MMVMMRGSMIITNQQACPDVIVGSMFIFNCPVLMIILCGLGQCSYLCGLVIIMVVLCGQCSYLCGLVHTCVVFL